MAEDTQSSEQRCDLIEFIDEIRAKDSEQQHQLELYNCLEGLTLTLFPGSKLQQFGSTVNGLSLRNADLDFCLFVDVQTHIGCGREDPSARNSHSIEIIVRLGEELRKHPRFENIMILSRARIPIIKFHDLGTGISCDIGVNNELAMYNTLLLKCYSNIDKRLIQLTLIVKYWAKNRFINEPYSGTLSSYCYTIMVIFYLQNTSPPVMPSLQSFSPKLIEESCKSNLDERENMDSNLANSLSKLSIGDSDGNWIRKIVDGYEVEFLKNTENLYRIWPHYRKNQSSLYSLLHGFFRFYAYEFPFTTSIVSIRTSRAMMKEDNNWTLSRNSIRNSYWFCVEDPFEISHNLARSVSKASLYFIRGQFIRASKLMSQNISVRYICSSGYY